MSESELVKITFDEQQKALLDERGNRFNGTRVSTIVRANSSANYLGAEEAERAALGKFLETGQTKYHADAYELISVKSRREDWGGEYETPSHSATALGIFYQRT
ncbi:hypothetical protein HYT55_05075 [Candidatus Woesearchaeota archaeon]|nr:hypothetical protein [Candidatus Woesearchaeota archaeon]